MRAFTIRETATQGLRVCAHVNELNPYVRIGEGEKSQQLPLSKFHRDVFLEAVETGVLQRGLGSDFIEVYLDHVAINQQKICFESDSKNVCVVHVETAAGEDGHLWYTASSFNDVLVGNSVEMKPNSFPPPGVKVICTGYTGNGANHLLTMLPGARFQIHRTGVMPKDAPRRFNVTWTGSKLFCDPKIQIAKD